MQRLLLAALVLLPANVHADIAPQPTRPIDWDDHPPPMPPPPPEKDPLPVAPSPSDG